MFAKSAMFLLYICTLCIFVLISNSAPTDDSSVDNGKVNIVDKIIDGRHVKIPQYDPETKPWKPERKAFDIATWDEFAQITNNLVKDILDNKNAWQLSGYPGRFMAFTLEKGRAIDELDKRGLCEPMNDRYVVESLQVYYDSKAISDKKLEDFRSTGNEWLTQGEKRAQAQQLYDDYVFLMHVMSDTVKESPVGFYLDWNRMTIDGVPLAQEMEKFYTYLRRAGYGPGLWLLDRAVSGVVMFKNMG